MTGATTYTYERRNQVSSKTAGTLGQAYTYDVVGNRSQVTDPDGGVYSITNDRLNRPSVVTKPTGYVYTTQYDANGRRTTLQLGLGSTRKYAYDAADPLTTQ